MFKTFSALTSVALAISQPASAQIAATYEFASNYQSIVKPLPPGFHHFRRETQWVEMLSDCVVLCREMRNAISYGKQLWLGVQPGDAVRTISGAWDGEVPCGYVTGLTLSAREYAVRGDDKGRPIFVVKWADQYGREHYTGTPRIP